MHTRWRDLEARHSRVQRRTEIEVVIIGGVHPRTRVKHARIELPFVPPVLIQGLGFDLSPTRFDDREIAPAPARTPRPPSEAL